MSTLSAVKNLPRNFFSPTLILYSTILSAMPDDFVSVLGLGLMGASVAKALVKANLKTSVWNRTLAKAAPSKNSARP